MKAAFNILPEINENEPLHLLIEVGSYGIACSWFTKNPVDIKGLAVYNFISPDSNSDTASEIINVLSSNVIFTGSNASVTICYDFKESLLVPAEYHNMETGKGMLELVYNADHGTTIQTDAIAAIDIFNTYAVDKRITESFNNKFPGAVFYHSTSLQLQRINSSVEKMHCIVFHNTLKVFLFSEDGLQFIQQFNYSKPVDAAYHLINCCEQHDIKSSGINLKLSGMIDEHSNLYIELYKYFLNISFELPDEHITMHERIKFYPSHFFSHLTALVSCVS
ncbi:hypothetical protein BH11BAC4_BH11BAC4_20020 [soil metagenome]